MTKEEIKFRRDLRKQVSDIINNINETCGSNNNNTDENGVEYSVPFSKIEGDFIGEKASMNLIQSLLNNCKRKLTVTPWIELSEDKTGFKLIGVKLCLKF